MGFVETIILLILILPVSFFIGTVFILAALGKSLGFRKKYVEFLLYIFEVSLNLRKPNNLHIIFANNAIINWYFPTSNA